MSNNYYFTQAIDVENLTPKPTTPTIHNYVFKDLDSISSINEGSVVYDALDLKIKRVKSISEALRSVTFTDGSRADQITIKYFVGFCDNLISQSFLNRPIPNTRVEANPCELNSFKLLDKDEK